MKDLLSVDQLSLQDVNAIHAAAEDFFKKNSKDESLLGKILVNFFFENSTRTRTSFEIAAKRLGAKVVNIDISLSSLKKANQLSTLQKQ